MLVPRLPVLSALLVLLLAAGRCTAAALLRSSSTRADGRLDGRSVLELVGRYSKARAETAAGLTGHGVKAPERKSRSSHGLEGQPRDPRHKEKFIRHLTGPLSFNPKCRKHFNRLYHNTRDCTIPAYYKRCARLLTRLANSPRCIER
ncbi:ALK and LTK ligand 2 [Thunnus albacares]|uniref:ALK and LTK ligand 2-like n=1 Tax=Thunnus maccoyii TaxID=8240 RepID=UPI001C4D3FFC|nr:ALK and LTK ligand 2-like [Thunnus maccoyii]XP_042260245.1 ALK and LTK ligand 2-like [Thunnus maccoyii]XP_044200358.1 ALK and LTK ligand 2 [Thunnus albacares]XP_044200359.1 ALK and LTK ligand 2 [Thunnus albacares]XP_044200361.1 ALK and LTK ligand 2 [Thunnus albacares]XP_044200362.1 ALK and LTK ligand 2 [Thunnus albacares]